MKKDFNKTEEALLRILQALFGVACDSDKKDEFCPHIDVVFDEVHTEEAFEDTSVKTEECDLLGELTASFILDGLDVTRKDTLLMVLFDIRQRILNGEKPTYHINLVYKR